MKFIRRWRRKGTLDKALAFCAGLISITAIYAMVVFLLTGQEPAELLSFIATICGAEGFLTAAIAIFKIKKNKKEKGESYEDQ